MLEEKVISRSRSKAIQKAWEKRKRKGTKYKCYRCGKGIWTGGLKRKGHWFHRNCYLLYAQGVPGGKVAPEYKR